MKKKIIFISISLLILISVSVFVVMMLNNSRAAGITADPNPASISTSVDYCFGWNVGSGGYAAGDYIEFEFDPAFNLNNLTNSCIDFGCLESTNETSLFIGNQTCNSSGTERIAYAVNNVGSPDMGFTDNITEPWSALYDSVNGYAYIGTYDFPAKIVKVKLSDFSYVSTLVLPTNLVGIQSGVIDSAAGYAYFGTISQGAVPASIIKIRLSDFTLVDTLDVQAYGDSLNSAVIDTDNHYAYFGNSSSFSTGNVIKIDLSDFSIVDTLAAAGDTAVIDTANDFAYFAGNNQIYKVDLSDFSDAGHLDITDTFANDITDFKGAVIDITNHYAYFGSTLNSPAQIVRIDLSDFSYDPNIDLLELDAGEDYPYTASIDVVSGYAYFGLVTSPGLVAKIKLSDFSEESVASGDSGEDYFITSFIDTTNHFIYFATEAGTKIVKFNLTTFSRDSALSLPVAHKAYFILGSSVDPDADVSIRFKDKNFDNSVLTPLSAGSYSLTLKVGDSTNYSVDYTDSTTLDIVDTGAFGDLIVNVFKMDGVTHLNGATLVYNCDGAPVTATDGGAGDDDGTADGVITRLSASVAADTATCNNTESFTQFDISSNGYVTAIALPSAYSTGAENDVNSTLVGNYRLKVVKEDSTGNFTGLGNGDFTFGTLHSDFREVGAGVYEFAIPAAVLVSRQVAHSGFMTNTGTNTTALSLQPAAQIDDSGTPLTMLYGLKVDVAKSDGAALSGLDINTFRSAAPDAINVNVLYWADTAGAAGSLSLQKTSYTNAETTNLAFSSITTATGAQIAITLGNFASCDVVPIIASSNCKGLISSIGAISYGGQPVVILPEIPPQADNADPLPAQPLPEGILIGTAVKIEGNSTVYFIDQDNRRHVFPSESVFLSIFPNFDKVITIPASTMAQIPVGSNVTVLAGTYLVKIASDPKVYAVEPYGVLRWITSEELAQKLYGVNWQSRVIDFSPAFFLNYKMGSDISTPVHPTGSLIQFAGSANIYRIEKGVEKLISPDIFRVSGFQEIFVIHNVSTDISYPTGSAFLATPIETLVTLR